jgi:lantibiotic transport system ATP-binding protein
MYCVATHQLSHRFSGQTPVLNNIHLQVPEGAVYGFLGPNGAGKTTTLRLLLGLLKKQEGTISIFNQFLHQHRREVLRNIGSLIESPSLYSHLTAEENLRIWQCIYQCPHTRIKEVLHTVGLSATEKKKAGKFSLGMKQRLSIAVALLHRPRLLVLDEPTNGLDPNGIMEIRDLITQLNREQGVSIIISSHLLAEIEKLVTHLGIIHKGTLLFQGTLAALKNKQQESTAVVWETSDMEKTIRILADNQLKGEVQNGKIRLSAIDKPTIAVINQLLVQHGVSVFEIGIIKNDLETIFMDIIK